MKRPYSTWILVLALAVVYFGSGVFGLSLAVINKSVSTVWPPTGIALAAVLLLGYRVWPGVFVGAFFVNLFTSPSVPLSLGIAMGNTLEALAGAWLVNRFAGGSRAFQQTWTILKFVLLAAGLSTLASSLIGPACLCLGGKEEWSRFAPVWLTWWTGDMVSDIVIAPLLLIWCGKPYPGWKPGRIPEAALLALLVFLPGQLVFGRWLPGDVNFAIGYTAIPPLLWAALRFGLRGASLGAVAVSAIAIAGTVRGHGPFAMADTNTSLLLLQMFMAIITLTAVLLAAAFAERESAVQARHEGQLRMAALVDSAMDAIITVNEQQQVVLYNHAAEAMFGFSAADMLGQPLERLLPRRFRAAHAGHIAHFGKAGVTNRRMGALGAISGLKASGQEFPIEASISQVELAGENFFTVILRDITERHKMEEALNGAQRQLEEHASRLEKTVEERTLRLREAVTDLEAFSYTVSHDLRAPLRVMRQFAEALLEDHGPSLKPEALEYLKRIAAAAERLDALICGVLTYNQVARSGTSHHPVNLDLLLCDILRDYPDLQAHQHEIKIEHPILPVIGSETFLTQCFANLLGNALKFVPPDVTPQVRVWAEARGSHVRVWIADNGIGIAEEHRQRIFGMFERLHSEKAFAGTGIGLAIVRRAVERMHGSIGFESEVAVGSKFWIELPGA